MELAVSWHRCQNLQKELVNTLVVYRYIDEPVKKILANQSWDGGLVSSFPSCVTEFRFVERKRNLAVDSPLVSMSLSFWWHLTILSGKHIVPTPVNQGTGKLIQREGVV